MTPHLPRYLAITLTLLLAACAGDRYHRQGMNLIAEGREEEGLDALTKAVTEDPGNAEFRKDLYVRRAVLVDQHLAAAVRNRRSGQWAAAEANYRQVLKLDSANVLARLGLDELVRDTRNGDGAEAALAAFNAGDADKAMALLRPILAENPEHPAARDLKREIEAVQARRSAAEPALKAAYAKPINLEFREANVRMVFEGLARTTGINFILDKDVRPDLRTTVFLRNASIEDAIELVLRTSQLQKKVLNNNTVLIYPNTAEKLKDYQDLLMKAFYLQNADPKQIQSTLKTMLKTKDIVIDEKLNLVVMRDTPDAIVLAEKLVAMYDLAEPEVMLEVEVLEVQRARLLNLGIQWPNQLTLTPLAASGNLKLSDLNQLNSDRIGAGVSSTVLNFKRDVTDANILANPRIRARNREKAKIMIGDKVPVVTTTTTATGLVSDSVLYIDVGLKLEVEPDIKLQDEVAIRIGMEVSSLVKEIRSPSGTLAYQIGSRNASTVLRLKDGETQILAGLISDEDRKAASGIPGLGDLPVLGRLFATQQDNHNKTEIVLSITPRIVRKIARPDASGSEFWSGTESTLATRPLRLTPMVVTPKPDSSGSVLPASNDVLTNAPATPKAAATAVSLNWQGPSSVKKGEVFKLEIRLKSDGTLRSLPFQAAFDPAAFQIVEVSEGAFFKHDGGATSFSSQVDTEHGKLMVSVTRSDVEGATGDDVVATVSVRALGAKPTSDMRILMAVPIVQGTAQPKVLLPAPFGIEVTP
jgi:general secretion pathway protein D